MKKISLLLLPVIATLAVNAQQSYTIKGKFENESKTGKVFCSHKLGEEYVQDSAVIKKGKFTIKGQIDEPTIATFIFKPDAPPSGPQRRDMLQVFMEPKEMEIKTKDSLKYAKVKGSPSNDVYLKFQDAQKPVNDELNVIYQEYNLAYKNKDDAKMKELDEKIEGIQKGKQAEIFKAFIKENTASPVALMAVNQLAGYDIDVPVTEPYWNMLDASLRNSAGGKEFSDRMEIARKIQPGKPAMEFIQNNVAGTPVKLSEFRGKYVLVDFWASWCGPCRQENPNVVKNYQKYKDKNFTVLGVSLDNQNQKDRWVKAIKDDQLEWTQVSDLKGWGNEVAVQYGIRAIPQNLLVGPDGIIVAKNLSGEKLTETLQKVLGE